MHAVIKYGIYSLVAGLLASVVDDTAVRVAGIAAGVAGAIYLHKNVILPFARLIKRALTAYQVLEHLGHLPRWAEAVDDRLDSMDERMDRLEVRAQKLSEPAEALARELGVQHRKIDGG